MNNHRRHPAQSLIEFALLLPLLFFLIMGLFDIGRAIFYYSILNTAVREGTRFAIVQSGCDYEADPSSCSGGELDTYPLDCINALSTANINICNEIKNYYFQVSDLSDSIITIDHIDYPAVDPTFQDDITVIIAIEFPFEPITPGLGLLGDFKMNVNSEMIIAPIFNP